MKELMEKIRGMKGGIWLILLCVCALLCLASPLSAQQEQDMTEEERRISRTFSAIAGAGECRVTIHYGGEENAFGSKKVPCGAVILSRGANDIEVRLRLLQAAEALLGLPPERIEIFLMEESI